MKQSYIDLLKSWPHRTWSRKAKNNPALLSFLHELFPGVTDISILIRCLMYDESPYCISCGKSVKFPRKKTCSLECRTKSQEGSQPDRVAKQKVTMMERYGVDNIGKLESTVRKRHETMKKRHGALVSKKSRESSRIRAADLNIKGRETLKERYGINNPGQLKDHGEKCKTTYLKKHGVDSYYKSDEYLKASQAKRLHKFQISCPEEIIISNVLTADEKKLLFSQPNKLIEFTCGSCSGKETVPSETFKWRIRNTGTPCITCGGISKGSLKENELSEFIKGITSEVIIRNDRILPKDKEIDIHIPSLQLGFEFDGLFWHNDQRIDKMYHKQKQIDASKQGIHLIHIFEDEWDSRKDIVKSRIMNIVGKITSKIHARKCEVKEITTKEAREFIDRNHIQGYAPSSVKIGLFHNSELVSVMTFSMPNLAKGQKKQEGRYELSRFCSILNTSVIGGASKLFSYFIKKYNPLEVLTFADLRWSEKGNLYKMLGFDYAGDTNLNYWYFKSSEGIRHHRFSLRKNKNDDQTLTEYENRINQGYLRIWDCGSSKWIWTNRNGTN